MEWDPLAGPATLDLDEEYDAVVHLAGESVAGGRWSASFKNKIYQSRILSTRLLVEALKRAERKPSVFVCASAVGIYGNRGDETLAESSSLGSGFLAEVCREWEYEAAAVEALDIRRVSLRVGLVLDFEAPAFEKMSLPFKWALGGSIGGGQQWMSWINLQDVVKLILHSIDHTELQGAVNATSPNPVRNEEFSQMLGISCKRPVFLEIPGIALRVLMGQSADLVLTSQRASAEKALASGFEFDYPDIRSALKEVCSRRRHGFVREQRVNRPIEEVFDFFSRAENLERITPKELNFKILRTSTPGIEKGTILDYRLSLHGIPFHWSSHIDQFNPPSGFSDEQMRGPYAYWRHEHEFEVDGDSTIVRDKVQYEMPLGLLGETFGLYFVRKDLDRIFAYRRSQIEALLNAPS